MHVNEDFNLISKALSSSYLSLVENGQEAAAQSLNSARSDFLKAFAHASAIDQKVMIDTLYNR
ncbi:MULTISPECIES: hypothetical protein [Bacillaceae]|uniref:hypothetical protein n=1 Tax=Bacillaceae TaxID=186817 RepID=UPI000C75B246|nr:MULTISPECIES: hypothetical protein [Bacillaceae]PLR66816.1 hypothetical protein CYJ36_16245 [Bacillus sp. UMB0893]QNG61496.1 hypothetical protein H4O14_08480 [Bacillus sp. PAMC26568]